MIDLIKVFFFSTRGQPDSDLNQIRKNKEEDYHIYYIKKGMGVGNMPGNERFLSPHKEIRVPGSQKISGKIGDCIYKVRKD